MLKKYCTAVLIAMTPITAQAKETNTIAVDINGSVVNEINKVFINEPQKKSVIWFPKIQGKSKYGFSIPKEAYIISKNNVDASDLYYLSEPIDNGITLHQNSAKNINIHISQNNYKIMFKKNFLSNINAGLFLERNKKSYGLNINKDFLISKNALGNFAFELGKDDDLIMSSSFIELTKDENAEVYGKVYHNPKLNIFNLDLGYTWFEIANIFDLTVDLKWLDDKITSDIYASIDAEKVKFQIGLSQIKNNSQIDLFLNFKFDNIMNSNKIDSIISISSKDEIVIDKMSLKKFRKQNLDSIWRKKVKF